MKIVNNQTLKQRFLGNLKEAYSGLRDGVHVSDLVYCVREAYYRKTEPRPYTERELGYFVDGSRRHAVIEELADVEHEVKVEKWGITGTVDILLDGPIEVKTTRARNSIPDHYFRQLGYYAVLLGVDHGYLVIQRLNGQDPWEFYEVHYSQSELWLMENEMRNDANLLYTALRKRAPELLPRVGSDMSWKCDNCKYRDRCKFTPPGW